MIEGSRFQLRLSEDVAVAVRTSPEFLPDHEDVARKAALLVQQESGCQVDWIAGDATRVQLGLSCDGRQAPPAPEPAPEFVCDVSGADTRFAALECVLLPNA